MRTRVNEKAARARALGTAPTVSVPTSERESERASASAHQRLAARTQPPLVSLFSLLSACVAR